MHWALFRMLRKYVREENAKVRFKFPNENSLMYDCHFTYVFSQSAGVNDFQSRIVMAAAAQVCHGVLLFPLPYSTCTWGK